MPQLTIGIPIYNAMPFLKESIESALSQTFTDIEILAINDGSTDSSLLYLSTIGDPRLRLITQENRGLTSTLNRMLREARSPWLVRLDADDICSSWRAQIVANSIQKYPDAGMFYSRAMHHNHPGAFAMVRSTEGSPAELRDLTSRGYLLSLCHSSVVLNVEKTLAVGGYRFDLQIEDLDLWWRMALRYPIRFIPEPTVEYRLNPGSVCSRKLAQISTNTIYAQYLLLSRLWNIQPRNFARLKPTLELMVDRQRLAYREAMWQGGIAVSRRNYTQAVKCLGKALLYSPRHFLTRCLYPFSHNPTIRIGEPPHAFLEFASQLWGDAASHEHALQHLAPGSTVKA